MKPEKYIDPRMTIIWILFDLSIDVVNKEINKRAIIMRLNSDSGAVRTFIIGSS